MYPVGYKKNLIRRLGRIFREIIKNTEENGCSVIQLVLFNREWFPLQKKQRLGQPFAKGDVQIMKRTHEQTKIIRNS